MHTLWGHRRRVQLRCANTAVPFLPAQQQHSPRSRLARGLLWTRSGNYRRFPKVWLMFQHLPITDCTLSHGQHVVGDPGIYTLVSTSWVPSLLSFFFLQAGRQERSRVIVKRSVSAYFSEKHSATSMTSVDFGALCT